MDTRNTDVKKTLEPLTSTIWTQETLMSKNIRTIDFHYMDTRNIDVQKHWNH